MDEMEAYLTPAGAPQHGEMPACGRKQSTHSQS